MIFLGDDMDFENIDEELGKLVSVFENAKQCLNLKELSDKLAKLLKERDSLSFWSNVDYAMETNKEIKSLQTLFDTINSLQDRISSVIELKKMIGEEFDINSLNDVFCEILNIKTEVDKLHIRTLLDGEYDECNAIVSIHSGAGGTEAYDWTSMLYRMYSMYAEKNGLEIVVTDILENSIGLKYITFVIKGEYPYGKLKCEKGVHRLVRISPYDSQKRRHTTFASVEVMPEIINDNTINISNEDLKIDTYRSQGAGGQNVNKTDSAVRITHIPTGIVVTCQNERSQLQNREMALKILRSKLIDLKNQEEENKNKEIQGELKKIEWGSQIRSYVFQPYSMVKDHRTNYETSDVAGVMDGGLEEIINDYLIKSHTINKE